MIKSTARCRCNKVIFDSTSFLKCLAWCRFFFILCAPGQVAAGILADSVFHWPSGFIVLHRYENRSILDYELVHAFRPKYICLLVGDKALEIGTCVLWTMNPWQPVTECQAYLFVFRQTFFVLYVFGLFGS